jgi:hypothetical protein
VLHARADIAQPGGRVFVCFEAPAAAEAARAALGGRVFAGRATSAEAIALEVYMARFGAELVAAAAAAAGGVGAST